MMVRKRDARQSAIRQIIRDEKVRTQHDLADLLVAAGHVCTQATVSRDVAEMAISKTDDGFYVLPEDMHLRRMFAELVSDVVAAQNLVVVKASAGAGPGVAAALDAAGIGRVVGSIAGDDTVLLVAADSAAAVAIVSDLERYRKR